MHTYQNNSFYRLHPLFASDNSVEEWNDELDLFLFGMMSVFKEIIKKMEYSCKTPAEHEFSFESHN